MFDRAPFATILVRLAANLIYHTCRVLWWLIRRLRYIIYIPLHTTPSLPRPHTTPPTP